MIAPSIPPKCSWKVAFDKSTGVQSRGKWYTSQYTGSWGHPVRNEMLSRLKAKPDDYVLFLDDDNLIHPNWHEHIKGSTADMVTWGQENKDGSLRLRATDQPKVGNIDMGSFMVKYKIAKQLKFTDAYEADGIFAMEAAQKASEIQVINESISYYNYLK
jgi:hypothetical protein